MMVQGKLVLKFIYLFIIIFISIPVNINAHLQNLINKMDGKPEETPKPESISEPEFEEISSDESEADDGKIDFDSALAPPPPPKQNNGDVSVDLTNLQKIEVIGREPKMNIEEIKK